MQLTNLTRTHQLKMLGHITSSYYSPNCIRSKALALIKNVIQKYGDTIYFPLLNNEVVSAKIVKLFFMIQMEIELMAYSYINLSNKSKLKSFSLFNNEQILSFDKKIGISIFIPTLINFYNIRGSKKNKDFDLSIKKFLNHKKIPLRLA